MPRLLAVLALACCLIAPAAAAPDPTLAQVQAHLRAVTTMRADFSQTDALGKTLTGRLLLKRPGRIRFQYQPGVPLLIVGDGSALTMVDYKVAQVSRWPIRDSPLAVLLDPDRDIARFAHPIAAPPGRLLIEGSDPRHPEFGTITMGFVKAPAAPGGLMLAGWTVVDAQGNRTTVVLTGQSFGGDIANAEFAWRDPRRQNRDR